MTIDLADPSTARIAGLATQVRRIVEGRSWTRAEIYEAIVTLMARELANLALVRVYRVVAGSDTVELVASRGSEASWEDLPRSSRYRVPLAEAHTRIPLVANVLDRIALREVPTDRLGPSLAVHVTETSTSPLIRDQRDFVARYGIRSALACGGRLPDGNISCVVMFVRGSIALGAVGELEALGLQARVALLDATDSTVPADRADTIRAHTLDALLRMQEYRYHLLLDDAEMLTSQTARLREETSVRDTQAAIKVQRGQRAMLNVIEDLREARSQLEQRVKDRTSELEDRNRELEQFVYVASHDLQEPLRTIAGYLQLIEQRYGGQLDSDAKEFIEFSVDGARRMQQLIEALLMYSRVTSRDVQLSEVALDDVVDDVLRSLDRAVVEAQASIQRSPLPRIHGDRIQLGQLFQNLIGNALKFRGDKPADIAIDAETDGTSHVITVTDRGIGFDNRHADRIFGVFRRLQRKYPGTGIGLAICKKIVERHGGTIEASASPGAGATFRVTLPAHPNDPARRP